MSSNTSNEVVKEISHLPIDKMLGLKICDQLFRIKRDGKSKTRYVVGTFEENSATPEQNEVLKFFLMETYDKKTKVGETSHYEFCCFDIYVKHITRDGYKICFHSDICEEHKDSEDPK